MPSPVGHVLAGVTIALAADEPSAPRRRLARLTVACGFLALAPDLDLLYPSSHRTFTHSLLATGLVLLATAAATRLGAGRIDWRAAVVCAAAYGTHLLTDYFGADPSAPSGIELLWPSHERFISSWSLFPMTERRDVFGAAAMARNALALAIELLVMVPLLLLAWRRRVRLEQQAATSTVRRD